MIALTLLVTVALSQDQGERTSWDFLHQAQLIEAGDGDLARAAKDYQALVRSLGTDAPFRGRALFALGRVRYLMGDIKRAREALKEGIRTNTCYDACNELLSQLELEQNAVREVPVLWTFDSPDHGFFHPWMFATRGSIRISEEAGRKTALVWETVVDSHERDMLVVGFDRPKPTPEHILMKMQSEKIAAQVEIVILDEAGNAFRPRGGRIPVPALDVMEIDVSLRHLVPIDAGSPPFDPSRISRFEIRDVSAVAGRVGPNALYIDDFEVR